MVLDVICRSPDPGTDLLPPPAIHINDILQERVFTQSGLASTPGAMWKLPTYPN